MSVSGGIAMGILRLVKPGKNSCGKADPEKLRKKARKLVRGSSVHREESCKEFKQAS